MGRPWVKSQCLPRVLATLGFIKSNGNYLDFQFKLGAKSKTKTSGENFSISGINKVIDKAGSRGQYLANCQSELDFLLAKVRQDFRCAGIKSATWEENPRRVNAYPLIMPIPELKDNPDYYSVGLTQKNRFLSLRATAKQSQTSKFHCSCVSPALVKKDLVGATRKERKNKEWYFAL